MTVQETSQFEEKCPTKRMNKNFVFMNRYLNPDRARLMEPEHRLLTAFQQYGF